MHTFYLTFLIFFAFFAKSEQKYVIPDINIQALAPKGLIVSMPDSSGVQQFAFHANINQEIKGKEDGTISRETGYPQNGIWKIQDPNIQLRVGDVLNYWVFVQNNRLGFDKQDQRFIVTELVSSTSEPSGTGPCKDSKTTINGGQRVCGNTKLFEDTFDNLDETKWIKEQYVPWGPDYEFNTYEKRNQNCYISGGNLYLKATVRENPLDVNNIDLTDGCTRTSCVASSVGTINPPIIGAKLTSKFSFQYGKIEIRAKLPQGNWLYPEMYLEPKDYFYGEGYKSGRMWIAYARGNLKLRRGETGEQIGNQVLYSGPVLHVEEPYRTYKSSIINTTGIPWGDDYHTYTLIWQPDGIYVSVDNGYHQALLPPYSESTGPYKDSWITPMAPFNKEFVISLGIGAGGVSDFPEDSTDGKPKPWKKFNSKKAYFFYTDKDNWFPSWSGDNSVLKIDYIRVWSL